MLVVRDIHTAYGLSRVLFGVSIEVTAGECVCLLGRNGVGKSTTMRSIMGLTPPQQGRVLWRGADITGWAPYRVARAGIGFVPEDRLIFVFAWNEWAEGAYLEPSVDEGRARLEAVRSVVVERRAASGG